MLNARTALYVTLTLGLAACGTQVPTGSGLPDGTSASNGPITAQVIDGVRDGETHSYVGIAIFKDAQGNPQWRCSGSFISPTVFLTAAHCTFGAASAEIWLQEKVTPGVGYPFTGQYQGQPISHPEYNDFAGFPNTHDIGVIVLSEGQTYSGKLGVVAGPGTLDTLATRLGKQDAILTGVGYGLQGVVPDELRETSRYRTDMRIQNLRSALNGGFNVQMSGDLGKGNDKGATCFGDSGGPILYQGQIVAVTSFGLSSTCGGPGFGYRTDTAISQKFINEYVPLASLQAN